MFRTRYALALAVLLAGCADETIAPDAPPPNQPPALVRGVPAQTLRLGGRAGVDLTGAFSDPDGDTLAYTAASSDTSVVFVAVLPGPFVALAGLAQGEATVTVMARDPGGLEARAVFPVSVTGNPDRAALVALYEATGGPEWVQNANWLTDAPLGEWRGVTANDSGRVLSLDLSRNALTGEIPPELGNLTALESLELDRNALTGPIPPELGNLTGLKDLSLFDNALTGEIPPELGNLTALEYLDLNDNALTGPIPPELGNLAALEELWLPGNTLTGPIPPELGNLAALDWLSLSHNALTGPIPPEFGNLAALERLSLYDNDLTGPVPPELGRLSALEWLGLSNNSLTGPIPPELGNLATLEILSLNHNALTGPIPPELGNLTALDWLSLDSNDLSGPIPPELGDLTALDRLSLSHNALTGPIPPELGHLTALERLSLDSNDLSGPIPPELGNLTALEGLSLSRNALTGEIPPELDTLAALQSLNLSHNALTGPIPPELGNLAALQSLNLDRNALSGPIPSQIVKLTALRDFTIDATGVCLPGTGAFLRWLERLTSFRGEAWCNEADRSALAAFYGATGGANWKSSRGWLQDGPVLSEWYGVTTDSLGRVAGLALPANDMAGGIGAVGALMGLKTLDVEDNPRLQGPLPLLLTRLALDTLRFVGTGLCSLPEARGWLEAIPFARGTGATCEPLSDRDALVALYGATGGLDWTRNTNWLTDAPVGKWYGVTANDSGRVVSLDLSRNALTGEIPPELGNLAALASLELDRNALTGPIPPELGNLATLQSLRLYDNALTGEIPPELGNLTALYDLRLDKNALMGEIPPELGNLTALEGLSLNDNALTGEIPPELGNLAVLEGLWLFGNALTGPIPPELGNLTGLNDLSLFDNALTGEIPPELGNLTALQYLYLNDNALTGPIPPELGNLTALYDLGVSGNVGLSGALPARLTALRHILALVASQTGLCAPSDPDFQRWVSTIVRYRVRLCSTTGAAYLVQSIQSRDYPVPLVAGRDALLRVFPTAPLESRVAVPPVRATFYAGTAEAYTVDIPAKPGPLPAEIDEGDLAVSANVVIPGEVLRPGLGMVVEIDPDGTLDPSLGIGGRIPESGRLALDVHALPTMELTVVPFLWTENPDSSVLAKVDGMAADPEGHELLRLPRALLPASDWSVTAHEPVWTDIRPVLSGFNGHALVNQTRAIRAMEGGRGYWMGTMDAGGLAEVSGWASVSALHGGAIAHELGHNLSLLHAPCGRPNAVDGDFPYSAGRIGAWGYDFTSNNLVSPDRADVMGYCRNSRWISDYHFTNALRHRVRAEIPSNSVRALLLWGGTSESGGPHLEPAFVVEAPPTLPDSTGGYTLEGRDASGRRLFSVAFAMPEIADSDEAAGGFAYTLPVRPGWETLASVTLTVPDGRTATLDGSTDRPMSILRDSRTGRVRAFLGGTSAPVQADGGGEGLAAALSAVAITSRGLPPPSAWRR